MENEILLIGPCANKKPENIIGGTIVLFEDLISTLKNENIHMEIIDSNKKNYSNIFFAYVMILFLIIKKSKNSKIISLHSSKDYFILMPFLLLIGKLFKKQISLRHFGMVFKETCLTKYNISNIIQKWIFSSVDSLFFETKNLTNIFLSINKNTYWFPNTRTRSLEPILRRSFRKRFVFIGAIREKKGMDEILKASLEIDNSYRIDIYGPIVDKKYTLEYFSNYNVRYLGSLDSSEVLKKMNEYDVLLLPTYYEGEGYPGVIIEAYSLGMPVITTDWNDIVEIVESKKTGILIAQQNVEQLIKAIEYFNIENYFTMSKKAYEKFDEFKSDFQTKLFLENLAVK